MTSTEQWSANVGTLRRWAVRRRDDLLGSFVGTVVGVDTAQPFAALTFDDGPSPASTPAILEVLERHGARATFFMVGRAAERFPELVARVAAGGHAVGNHTLDHDSLPRLDGPARRLQIEGGASAIGPTCSRLFRPPFGHQDLSSWWSARRLGYEVVTWSAHCGDWRDQDVETLTDRIRSAVRPGAIVLLHDALHAVERGTAGGREALVASLDRMLAIDSARLTFVTLPELLAAGRVRRRGWWKRGDERWLKQLRIEA